MSATAIYQDLSAYYDVLCAEIDYAAQAHTVTRLQQLFGNGGQRHLDLACGTGRLLTQLQPYGWQSQGIDLNPAMLAQAQQRCPLAVFSCQDMAQLQLAQAVDVVTCLLYSIHYNASIQALQQCIERVHAHLADAGLWIFDMVDKQQIQNTDGLYQQQQHADGLLRFQSAWYYPGAGDQQQLHLHIEKQTNEQREVWQDCHVMVAVTPTQLATLLEPYFTLHWFEHDFERLVPWQGQSGNLLVAAVKRPITANR